MELKASSDILEPGIEMPAYSCLTDIDTVGLIGDLCSIRSYTGVGL